MSRRYYTERRIWLTGASSGIGRALAAEMVRRGARVAMSARTLPALELLADELGRERTLVLPIDVTSREANREAVARMVAAWGGLDTAIFNAGGCEYVDVRAFDASLFQRQFEVNFMAAVYGIEAALPALRHSFNGHLVGVSSAAAYVGLPRAEAYGASKAALQHLLSALRVDLHREGIAVTTVFPGFVRTPLTERNDFPMPFLLEADGAARRIADGMARRRQEVHFPRRLTVPLRLLGALPQAIAMRLLQPTVRTS